MWTFPEQGDPNSCVSLFARGSAINVAADGSASICFGSSTGMLYVMALGEDGRWVTGWRGRGCCTAVQCQGLN